MALTAATKVSARTLDYFELAVRNAAQVYTGSMCSCDAAGALVPAGHANSNTAAFGRARATLLGDGTTRVIVDPGVYLLANSAGTGAITAADRGKLCYAVDDNTVHRLSGTRQVMGVVYDVETAGVWVTIDPNLVAAVLGAVSASSTTIIHARGASTADVPNLAAFTVAGVDGLTYVASERILLKDQNAGAENGVYVVGTVAGGLAPLTRALDADGANEVVANCIVAVSEGTLAADTMWQLTTNSPITVGTTALTFTAAPLQFGLVGAIVAITPDVASGAGTAATAARIDHVHGAACAAPVAGGVVAGGVAAEGAANTFARSDHVHGVLANVAPGAIAPDDVAAAGAAATFAASDHVHGFACAAPPVAAVGMGVAAAPAEGVAATSARSDHDHALGLPAATGEGDAFYIYHTFGAGGGGADDVTIYNADCPYALRILDCGIQVATAGAGGSTLTVRDTAGGAGAALSSALSTAATAYARTALTTAMGQVAAGGSLVLRRTDNTCIGEFYALCMRTA